MNPLIIILIIIIIIIMLFSKATDFWCIIYILWCIYHYLWLFNAVYIVIIIYVSHFLDCSLEKLNIFNLFNKHC